LKTGLRLRTACDLETSSINVTRPSGVDLSNHDDLLTELTESLPALITACNFGDQPLIINKK
jgi:hypothetical protein